MKNRNRNPHRWFAAAALAVSLSAATLTTGCKDEVDASNLVTKTEATVWDYIDSVAIYCDHAPAQRGYILAIQSIIINKAPFGCILS